MEIDVVCDAWALGSGALLRERSRMRHHEPTSCATLNNLWSRCRLRLVLCKSGTLFYLARRDVVCDMLKHGRVWPLISNLHLKAVAMLNKYVEWSLVGLDVMSCPVCNTCWILEFEFGRRSPHVLSMRDRVLLGGNRTWHHVASSKVAWVIDTWQLEVEGFMYP